MASENSGVDWAAALADIEARIAKLQGIAVGIREMLASGSHGTTPLGGPGGGLRPDEPFTHDGEPNARTKAI